MTIALSELRNMADVPLRFLVSCCLLLFLCPARGFSQNTTYHLHSEAVSPWGGPTISTANPDTASTFYESVNLKTLSSVPLPILQTNFQFFRSVPPSNSGVIPANSTISFSIWMKKTASWGTIFPYFRVIVYANNDVLNGFVAQLCSVTGTTALTTTLTKYSLSCVTTTPLLMTSTQAFRIDVGYDMTANVANHNEYLQVYYEGTLNGNYDSTVVIPRPLPPTISSLSPSSGPAGTSVTVNGARFGSVQGTSTVKFGSLTASPASWSDTSITVPVPSTATTSSVVVTVGGAASNGVIFTVPPPNISAVSPPSGNAGAIVTVSGTGFGNTQGTSTLKLGSLTLSPTSWSNTSIPFVVPATAATGLLVVTVNGVAGNGWTFTVPPPTITSLSPSGGNAGAVVTITGTGFGAVQGASTLKLGSMILSPTGWSSTSIQWTLPVNATNGAVVVTVNGVSSAGVPFTVLPPVIANMSPLTGGIGTYVTLTGTGFGVNSGVSGTSVTFNGVTANPVAWSDTSIYVSVPAATTGPVVVTFGSQPSNGVTFTMLTSGSVSGVVRRAVDNAPVSGVVVKAFQTGIEKGATATTADGSYILTNLPHGTYDIAALPAGYLPATNAARVVFDGQTTTANFALLSPTISGLSPLSGSNGTSVTITGSNFGVTQGTSTLTFNGVMATPTRWSDTVITALVPAAASSGLVVVTESGVDSNGATFAVGTGGFNGTVTQANTGTPIAGALVELLQTNIVKASTNTIADGTYAVANLNPGVYNLRFSGAGFGTVLSAGKSLAVGDNPTVNAALPLPGGIAGRVTRTDGTMAIVGSTVSILSGAIVVAATSTDGSGNYAAPSLGPGTYSVTAAASGYTDATSNGIVVNAGSITTSNVRLAGQSVITYTYDNLGRLKTVTDSLGGAATYNYDAVGNILSITNQ